MKKKIIVSVLVLLAVCSLVFAAKKAEYCKHHVNISNGTCAECEAEKRAEKAEKEKESVCDILFNTGDRKAYDASSCGD